ncbi:MAG: hypothetical protein HKN47_27915 [Pirellulaceae bacterium]|nr:hypothetical protein [Pirellulaceae bacterium]
MPIKIIVTHPGSAHKDDFLACCLLAHLHRVPIQRRDPTAEDLADPDICVVDVGGSHDPALQNFDHHHFPRDHAPLCALSLVLQSIDLYDDAKQFCSWLGPAEWLDTRGPMATAREMGIPPSAFNALLSPIDITLLRRFAVQTQHAVDDPLYQVMEMIGDDLVGYLRSLRGRLDDLKNRCDYWTISSDSRTIQAIFLERTDPVDEDPSFGLEQFVASECPDQEIVAMVYPDRRGSGYGLTRYRDNKLVDFSRIEACEDVRFAHKRGFVAKTDATDPSRLKELLAKAIV